MNKLRHKILWVSHFVIFPPDFGARVRSYNLLKELAQDFEIDLIMFDPKGDIGSVDFSDSIKQELEQYVSLLRILPLRVNKHLFGKAYFFLQSFFSRFPVSAQLLYRSGYFSYLRSLVRKNDYSIIYFDNIELVRYFSIAEETKIIVGHQNVESLLLKRMAEKHPVSFLKRYLHFQAEKLCKLEKDICPKVSSNVCVSEHDRNEFLRFVAQSKFHVISNGVDIRYFSFGEGRFQRSPQTLIWAGGMNWLPNCDAIIYFVSEVWPFLANEHKEIRLQLIGKCPPPEINKAVEKERITCSGYVKDVRQLLSEGDIYIVPLRIGGGTRLKILEAFSVGIPVVSTSIGCEGIKANDGEHILLRDGKQDFKRGIEALLLNAELRRNLSINARKLVEKNYSWDKIGEEFRSVFRDAIDRNE